VPAGILISICLHELIWFVRRRGNIESDENRQLEMFSKNIFVEFE